MITVKTWIDCKNPLNNPVKHAFRRRYPFETISDKTEICILCLDKIRDRNNAIYGQAEQIHYPRNTRTESKPEKDSL